MLYAAVSVAHVPYYVATPISFLIAVSCNYVLSRQLVFSATERSWHRGYVYFAVIAVLGAAITTGLVALLVSYVGLHYLIARILVAGLVGIGNYLFNLYVNFKVVGKHVLIRLKT
jgi:putative flippase GtrA